APRQYEGPDLTGRRGSFTRSSLLGFVIGQIREHEATSFSRSDPCEFSPIPSRNGWNTPTRFHLSFAWLAGLSGDVLANISDLFLALAGLAREHEGQSPFRT